MSFVAAIVAALCAGSITVFSLYGHIFQERLRYTQLQINGLSIAAEIALYLPVSALGYLCDRHGAAPLSLAAAALFGSGYGLAAFVYRSTSRSGAAGSGDPDWAYPLMVSAFCAIGVATCAMYLAAVATCAKNFGAGRHRGLALAAPIAAFGLSGMWLSQFGSRVLCERSAADGSCGDVDVFKFFVFLAALLFVVGVAGAFTLRVVDETELIDAAVEELERSGLLDGSGILGRSRYGTVDSQIIGSRGRPGREDGAADEEDAASVATDLLDPAKDLDDEADAAERKKWLLNAETRAFLTDRTMWWLALGFFLIIGPGEAFINNLGTIIGSLYPAPAASSSGAAMFASSLVPRRTSAATHVSIVGVTSTVARLLTGTLSDALAPRPAAQHVQLTAQLPRMERRRLTVSRVVFLLAFGALMSAGLVTLASGLVQGHGERFWVVSGLVGAGYGAVFSLTPIIISCCWGVENFGTNWGIVAMFPAVGATFWGLVYSAVYQAGARSPSGGLGAEDGAEDDIFCYGTHCYAPTFWAMAVTVWIACGFILYAWKGKGGWKERGIAI